MSVLTEEQRASAWAEMMRLGGVSVSKGELRDAFNAIDDWFDANAVTLNGVLPLPARTGLTTPQKALLLSLVIRARYAVGA